jgi:hypothetical protein
MACASACPEAAWAQRGAGLTSTTCTRASSRGALKLPKRWMPLRSPRASASACNQGGSPPLANTAKEGEHKHTKQEENTQARHK